MKMDLSINILPIRETNFEFVLYCKDGFQDEFDFSLYKTTIEEQKVTISYTKRDGFIEKTFFASNHVDLTKWYLFHQLVDKCAEQGLQFVSNQKFIKSVDIIEKEDSYGREIISVTPTHFFLNSENHFGFILNFRFRKNDNVPYSVEVQKKSLSLDKNGGENKNYYIDKYNKLNEFKSKNKELFSAFQNFSVQENFQRISAATLKTRSYRFGNSNINNSQFQGIKRYGPYLSVNSKEGTHKICFIYKHEEKVFSHKLYYALEGKTFTTFPGMEKMFCFPLNKKTVIGRGVDTFSLESVTEIILNIKIEFPNAYIVPVLIVPWTKELATEEENKLYFELKHLFLRYNMACQFISLANVQNDSKLKWSVSGMALQIFSKLGGSPWILEPQTSNCLIIGLGQAYQKQEDARIKRFFSYSILTDTTGLFKGIKILADTNNRDDYAIKLANSLKKIISEYSREYSSFVIHTSFRMKKKDVYIIRSALNEVKKENDNINLAILRFDDKSNYMCFDENCNSLVPYESTKVALSHREYLLWFEGRQYGDSYVNRRIGPPVKIVVDYPKEICIEKINDYLQDSINLSGANWRGFNAKSIPISLLYAELISNFISQFDKYNLGQIDIENLTPWFL